MEKDLEPFKPENEQHEHNHHEHSQAQEDNPVAQSSVIREDESLDELDARLRRLTVETLQAEIGEWVGPEPRKPRDRQRWLCFLGTGGSPRNLLTQTRRTGGFVLNLPDFMMHIDPGPGAIYHANYFKLDPTALDAVYISHAHTDHYTEANTMIEAMCRLMSQRRGYVLAPAEVFDNSYISPFHQGKGTNTGPYRGGPSATLAMQPENSLALESASLTPHRAYHGGENYGFTLEYKGWRLGYTSDTSYIKSYETKAGLVMPVAGGRFFGEMDNFSQIVEYHQDLKENYNNLDILVANVGYHHIFAHRHFTAHGLIHLLKGSNVKLCLVTHLDSLYFTNPGLAQDMARFIQEKSGVRCIVPEEGVKIEF